MSHKMQSAINSLLTGWWAHQELRQQGASVAELNESAVRLEEMRTNVRGLL
ncbi:MAG: hypothetical protein AAF531_00540 [Actinomycetota bacterium]